MPLGQATSTINAALGLGPKPNIEAGIGPDPMARLQAAYQRGVVNFNDLLDAATTKPKARAALAAQLDTAKAAYEAQGRDVAEAEARRPDTKAALDAAARSAAASGRVKASMDEAIASGLTPDAIADIAGRSVDSMRIGAQVQATAQAAKFQELEHLIDTNSRSEGFQALEWELATKPERNSLLRRIAALGGAAPPDDASDKEVFDYTSRFLGTAKSQGLAASGAQRVALTKRVNELGGFIPPEATDEEVAQYAASFVRKAKEEEVGLKMFLARADSIVKNAASVRDAEMKLATEFRKEPMVANADVVRTQHGIITSMLSRPKPSAASDMAAIFAFMKMMDPGSVVREGEYERAKNAAGFIQRYGLKAMWDRVSKGTLLNPEQRKDFLETATAAAQSNVATAEVVRSRLANQAVRQGLNPENVVFDVTIPPARSEGIPTPNLAPNEVLIAEKDPKTEKRTGRFAVFIAGPGGALTRKTTPTPGIDAPDGSFDPKKDVIHNGSDIAVRASALPAF